MNGYTPGLNVRILWWAKSRGWRLSISVDAEGRVTATVGLHVGRGRTASEALNELGDLLAAHEGWPDDRRQLGRVAA